MKRFIAMLVAFAALSALSSGTASAKQCRDASGKFTKCPAPMASAAPKHCRDASGKFVKCPGKKM